MFDFITKYFYLIEHNLKHTPPPPSGALGGGWGAPHVTPKKNYKKLDHKNAIKNKNRGPNPPLRYSHNPKLPLKRI